MCLSHVTDAPCRGSLAYTEREHRHLKACVPSSRLHRESAQTPEGLCSLSATPLGGTLYNIPGISRYMSQFFRKRLRRGMGKRNISALLASIPGTFRRETRDRPRHILPH